MLPPRSGLATHDVVNQPDERGDADLWGQDAVLRDHAVASGADALHLAERGRALGTADLRAVGREAMRAAPELRIFDTGGRRLDEVAFHPSYHRLLTEGIAAGYAALPWEGARGGHATHAAMVYLHSQVEPGTCCPMTMTYAAVPALATDPGLAALWGPRLVSRQYDPRVAPVAAKTGATMGMAMTEKQGGSDLRANSTRAEHSGDHYRLTGHKWFCSAPMSDGFLTLAQAPGGLSCFLVPRWLDDRRNGIAIQRLKDKLGNRANASAEIEYQGAVGFLLGEEGAGVRTIIEMVHHTRLDTAAAPAGLMRAALAEAHRWASRRTAFQRQLVDQPLMRAVLADLALDAEASLALALRAAQAFDTPGPEGRAFARLSVALAKYHNNKLCPPMVAEAMEVLGGMGYVEDTALPWLYREAPLNGIWEGSGNVICLDILRTVGRDPLALAVLDAELDEMRGAHPAYRAALSAHRARWGKAPAEAGARWFAESLATLLAAATLLRRAPSAVAEAYCSARLGPDRGRTYGAGSAGAGGQAILARVGAD